MQFQLRNYERAVIQYLTNPVNYLYLSVLVNYMLRLSTRGRYGVRAMYEIAKAYPNPVSTKHISERQALSVPYLEQILNRLKNAGLLVPIKGPGGGYTLSKRPEEISILDVLKVLDGPPALASCLDPRKGCLRVDLCVTHVVWKKLSEQIEGFLKTITLSDLLKLGENIGGAEDVDA